MDDLVELGRAPSTASPARVRPNIHTPWSHILRLPALVVFGMAVALSAVALLCYGAGDWRGFRAVVWLVAMPGVALALMTALRDYRRFRRVIRQEFGSRRSARPRPGPGG